MQAVYNAPMPAETRTKAPSAKVLAYDHLKARIASIELRDGLFITEGEIADELGVSRTPVREAFLRLEGEGLLQLVPQKGAFVPPVSGKEIDDVMETREVIEVHCAERLARDGSDIHRDLARIVDGQRKQVGDVEAFVVQDRRFHERIVDSLGNALLTDMYRALRDRQMRMGIRAVVHSPDRAKQVISEHRRIVSALRDADPVRTAEAIRTHLRATQAILKGEEL